VSRGNLLVLQTARRADDLHIRTLEESPDNQCWKGATLLIGQTFERQLRWLSFLCKVNVQTLHSCSIVLSDSIRRFLFFEKLSEILLKTFLNKKIKKLFEKLLYAVEKLLYAVVHSLFMAQRGIQEVFRHCRELSAVPSI
jgi:hypothetical protein